MAEKIIQTNTITHPRYGCAVGAAFSVAAIPGAIPIANCGPGCIGKQGGIITGASQGSIFPAGGNIPSVNWGENEVVFGGAKKLDALINATVKIMKGDLFVVLTGCSGELVGDDVESVVRKYRNKGYSVVNAGTAGFKGNNLWGHEEVTLAIIDQFVGDYKGKKRKKLVNLWFEVPYYNSFWKGDYIEIQRILEGAGFDVNIMFGPLSKGTESWKNIPKASFNLLISPWVGLKTVKHLEEKYNQPYLHFPVVPIGEEAVTDFIRKTVEFAGIDKTRSENFIAQEAKQYYYFLEHFSNFFSQYWFGLPSKFAVVGDSTYNVAFTKFLADQIGLVPLKNIITDNPPEKYREGIREIYRNISDGVSIEPEFAEDGYIIENSLSDTDFGGEISVILGSSWEKDIAAAKNATLIETSVPSANEVVLNRSYVGYRGALTLIEKIYTSAMGNR